MSLLAILINLLILCVIGAIVWWVVFGLIKPAEPFARPVQIILGLIFLLFVLGFFFGGVSMPFITVR